MDGKDGTAGSSRSYLLRAPGSLEGEVDRLRSQAELLFSLERECLKSLGLCEPKKLLELGCGNGQYLTQWKKAYPNAEIGGVDRHEHLLGLSRASLPTGRFFQQNLLASEPLITVLEQFKPDTVVLRFVLQHLNLAECRQVLSTLRRHGSHSRFQLILIEPDDSSIRHAPPCPKLSQAIEAVMKKQAANGGDRTRGLQLASLLAEAGFDSFREGIVDVGSRTTGWPGVRSIYLPLWKQGASGEEGFRAIETWIRAAEAGKASAELRCPVHVVLA